MFIRIKNGIRSLWKNGAFHIMIGTFLSKFVVFFGSIFVVRLLSKEDFGLLSYAENFYSYAYIFAGFGLSNALIRYIVLEKNKQDKYNVFSFIVKRGTVVNFVIVGFLIILSILWLRFTILENSLFMVVILAFVLPFQNLVELDLFTERALFANKRYAYLSASISIVLIIGRVIGARLFGSNGVACSRLIINFLLAILLLLLIKKTYFDRLNSNNIEKDKKKEIHKYSFQYMITNGLWTMFMLNDVLLLGVFKVGATVIADYKVAYVLPGCLSLLSNAIGTFVGPYFVKNEQDKNWIRNSFIKTFISSISLIGIASIILFVFSPFFIIHIYGESYINVVPIMRLLCISAFLNSALRYTTANILAAMGQVKYNMIMSTIGFVLQIVLDILIIPFYSAYGAALVNIVVYGFMAMVINIIFCKKYKILFERR